MLDLLSHLLYTIIKGKASAKCKRLHCIRACPILYTYNTIHLDLCQIFTESILNKKKDVSAPKYPIKYPHVNLTLKTDFVFNFVFKIDGS